MTDRIEKARQELDAICAMETRTQAEILRDVRATMLRLNGRTDLEDRLRMTLTRVADDGTIADTAAGKTAVAGWYTRNGYGEQS